MFVKGVCGSCCSHGAAATCHGHSAVSCACTAVRCTCTSCETPPPHRGVHCGKGKHVALSAALTITKPHATIEKNCRRGCQTGQVSARTQAAAMSPTLGLHAPGCAVPCGTQQRRLVRPCALRQSQAAARVPRRSAARGFRSGPAVRVLAAAGDNGTSNGVLPWQAAMDEIKKRSDIKSIMIIGAGPIVIGQVRQDSSRP